jgi:N-acetylmuramoyl-L-alanine amidase
MLIARNLLLTALATIVVPQVHGEEGPLDVYHGASTSEVQDAQTVAKSAADATAKVLPDAPPVPSLTKKQRSQAEQCLALNIYHEARSESAAGQRAVAAVTLNRVASKSFPSSVCKVVQQGGKRRHKCQFSWWCDNKSDKPREPKAWRHALELSRKALSGQISDPTMGALYYHANYVKPRWARTFKRTSKIGRHLFYKPRGA